MLKIYFFTRQLERGERRELQEALKEAGKYSCGVRE
jgi:hypothetical protein